jgi:hypothetical protein
MKSGASMMASATPRQGGIALKRLVSITTLVVFASFVGAVAYSPYLKNFNDLYGTKDTILDNCATCHGSGNSRNDYALDFLVKLNELGNATSALQAIEPLDSDNDGDSNIAEINARTFPGNPASNLPVEGSTWGKIKSLYE